MDVERHKSVHVPLFLHPSKSSPPKANTYDESCLSHVFLQVQVDLRSKQSLKITIFCSPGCQQGCPRSQEKLLVQVLEMHRHSGTASLPMSDEAKGAGPPWQLKSLLYGKGIHPTAGVCGAVAAVLSSSTARAGPWPPGPSDKNRQHRRGEGGVTAGSEPSCRDRPTHRAAQSLMLR